MVKVSVIVPIYNVELYLRECLEHIRMQTLKEIEVILVNDGSDDNSVQIAEEYVRKDKRFQLISQENQGLSVTRNNGLKLATGKYVHFCDSDDYLAYNALEILYETAEYEQTDIVQMSRYLFYDGEEVSENEDVCVENSRVKKCYGGVRNGCEMMCVMLETSVIPQAQRMFLKREFLTECEVSFYPGILHEDNLFFFHVYWNAKRVYWLPKRLYYLRKRPGSITTTKHYKKSFEGFGITFLEMWDKCKNNNDVVQQYPNILKYVFFCFAQTLYNYKRMTIAEKRQCRDLIKQLRKRIREVPMKITPGMWMFSYTPILLVFAK